ncbi:DUF1631 family protein [Congregibacter sp.]|uniref:DUF1631 family protein n=1 Tax=Congregibacter sp. TaxID=2744308 RepID=UPI003F6BDEF2
MSLSLEHIPLPCSLKDKVQEIFAPQNAALSANVLPREKLIAFLAKSKDTDSSPLATIKRRAAKQGLNPDLGPEDHATLVWICEAFDEWEDHYPLEQPLRDHIRRLLPLAISVALKEESFYTPGSHDLHRLLDALQNGAVGWQVRLDRAGQMLEQRVQRAVEKALEWFNNDRLDIAAITHELIAANERDAARAQRMVQRLAETEEARLKTLSARRDAAMDINVGLEKYELPAAIGEFLKGPWYDSAQLVLVKHGAKSREWEQMSRATLHLMESVQAPPDRDDAGRDRQEQILRYLPSELRRWLLSLEHDSDATDSAIGLVEYAHLRIQHGQKLQLIKIPTIDVEAEPPEQEQSGDEGLANGDWYQFEDDDGELRAQLVLQLENSHHLLFTNFVGLKALDLSVQAFSQRVRDGFSVRLPNRETFSLSLAAAAGIDSDDRLRQFIDPSYQAQESDPDPVATDYSDSHAEHESDDERRTYADRRTHDEDRRTHDEDRRSHDDVAEPEADEALNIEDVPDTSNIVASAEAENWSDELPDLSDAGDWDPVLEPPEGAELELTLEEEEPLTPISDTPAPLPEYAAPPPSTTEQATPAQGGFASPTPPKQDGFQAATPAPSTAAPVSPPAAAVPPQAPAHNPPPAAPAPAPPPPEPEPQPAAVPPTASAPPPEPSPQAPSPPASTTTREVDVPMGAWLGFHDGETPIMAKLAVFDPRRDNYIFVNRKGIALRELSRSELVALMDQGLVDILETRSYFRDEVEKAREER